MSFLNDLPVVIPDPNYRDKPEEFSLDRLPVVVRDPTYQEPKREVPPKEESPLGPIEGSWERWKGQSRLGAAGVTDAMGWPEWTKSLRDQAEANLKEADRYKPKVPSYTDIWKDGDVGQSLSNLGQYLYEGGAESLSSMGATAAGAIAGAPLGPFGAIAGGTLANVPSYTGSNIQGQMQERNVPFEQTDLGAALPTAVLQAGLDTAIGWILPGVGKAAAGGMFVRALKKGAQGGAIEGLTEGAQQALEIAQASPAKLFEFSPEIKQELLEAMVKGGSLGLLAGGASGAVSKRPAAEPTPQPAPQEDEPLPPAREYVAQGTGLPVENVPLGLDSGTGLPEYTRIGAWKPFGTGMPIEPDGEVPADQGWKPTGDTGIADVRIPEKNGQKVYKDIQQQLYAAGINPIQANSVAKYELARYETLGAQLGVSPWDAYKASNVQITGSKSRPVVEATTDPEQTLSQDDDGEVGPAVLRSHMVTALNRTPMKEGTIQQWINAMKKQGVKDEEIEWVDGGSKPEDWVKTYGNNKLTKGQVQNLFQPYKLGIYEARPNEQGKQSYAEWSLGGHGKDPASNYREIVVGDEGQPVGTYESGHWPKVPNPLGHYRTTERMVGDSQALHVEEYQSDWHQRGRRAGYLPEDMEPHLKRENELFGDLNAIEREYQDTANRFGIDEFATPLDPRLETIANRYNAVEAERLQVRSLIQDGVPKAPYQQSWPNLLFRQSLLDAINQDKQLLTWNTGANMPEVEGWGSKPDPKKVDAMKAFYDKRIVDYANKLGKPFGVQVEKATVPSRKLENWESDGHGNIRFNVDEDGETDPMRLSTVRAQMGNSVADQIAVQMAEGQEYGRVEGHPGKTEVWSLPINDVMREVIRAGGLPLFQKAGIQPKGNITIGPDKTFIRIFKNGDISTVMHELAHLHLSELERYAPDNKAIAQDVVTFKTWAGLEPDGRITRKEHELWARGFEEYLATGKAPTPGLKGLYEQFRHWLLQIYGRIQKIIDTRPADLRDIKLTKEMRGVYDRLVKPPGEPITEERAVPGSSPQGVPGATAPGVHTTYLQKGQQSRWGAIKQSTNDIFDPFSRVEDAPQYRKERDLFAGEDYAAQQAGRNARDLFSKLKPPEQEAVTRYLESAAGDIMSVPQPLRAQTKAVKKSITDLGAKLVQRKLLDKDVYEKNKDGYLPRLYLKHFLEGQGITSTGMRANLSEIKHKKNKTLEERTALGEIRHPSILSNVAIARMGRDVAAIDFLDRVSQNEAWSHPKSTIQWNGEKVSPQWLVAEAEQVRDRASAAERMNPDQATEMRAIADKMEATGKTAIGDQDYDPKEWTQLPNTVQFGRLRGAWVHPQIATDIKGMVEFSDPQSWAERMLGDKNSAVVRATQAWKSSKVVWNVASHGRNFISAAIQANLYGGVPLTQLPRYMAKAARDIKQDGTVWQAAKKYGIPHSNMGEAEFRSLVDGVAKDLEHMPSKWPDFMFQAGRVFSKINEFAGDKYQATENLYKTTVMAYHMDKGMAPDDAARAAKDALFDYSETTASVKYLRNAPLGAPFIVYTMKTLPMLQKTLSNPKTAARVLPYLALSYTIPALVAGMNDLKDDDPERLRMALSEGIRRQKSMYLMPWKDQNGRWQFLDVGYLLPWQFPHEVIANALAGDRAGAVKPMAQLAFSSPVASVLTALKTGIDPFTDRSIANKKDPVYDQVLGIVKYVWDLSVPSVLASYGLAGKTYDKMTGSGTNRYGEPPADWGQIAARGIGLNTYSVDPEAQRARNLRRMQHEIQDIKGQMSYNMKDQSLTPGQRDDLRKRFIEKIKDQTQELQKYMRESEMTPSLREATRRP